MVHEETVTAAKKIRSDGLLIALIIAGIAVFLWLAQVLSGVFPLLQALVQLVMFFLLITAVYHILRKRLTVFRYVLTEKQFLVYRATGRQERRMECVELSSIQSVQPYGEIMGEIGRENNQSAAAKGRSFAVRHRQADGLNCLIISPGEETLKKLQAAWRVAQEEGMA